MGEEKIMNPIKTVTILWFLMIAPIEQNSRHNRIQGYKTYNTQSSCEVRAEEVNKALKYEFVAFCRKLKLKNN